MDLASTTRRISIRKIDWRLYYTGLRRMLESMDNARSSRTTGRERIFATADSGCGRMKMQSLIKIS